MPTNFIMGTWLAKVTVGGGGLRWIGTMTFLIKPTTSLKTFLSTLFNGIQ
jgi:hypothetical protein